jgi:phosphate transport system substrate-binding protein
MNINQKTVLLFQPSKFQAQLWRFILWEHDIFVVWKKNYPHKENPANYFKKIQLKPNLLIIDLKINNSYELCRYFHQYYPSSKIILTTDLQHEYSSAIGRWSANQGVDQLLINFQKENLLSSVITNINYVLKVLDFPPAQQERIVKALDFLEQENVATPQRAIQIKAPSTSTQDLERIKDKTISSISRLSFFLVILLIATVVLDVSTLYLISPIRGLQRKILAYGKEQINQQQTHKEQTKITNTKASTLQELNDVPRGIFNYGGSTTWAPIRKIVNPKITKEYPEFNLRYLASLNATPGSGSGIRMLLEGEIDFSQSSRSIEQEEHILAHQRGFTLKEYPVAVDAIVVAVHPSLQVSGLTIEQLEKIYLGQITNWKEVNGPDLEILPLSRRAKDGGTPEFFQHHVLQNQPFGSNIKYVYSTTDGLRQIGHTPGGIYYASAPEVVPQCTIKSLPIADKKGKFIPPYLPPSVLPENCPKERNRLNIAAIKNATYPLTRYLFVIVKHDGGRAQKGGEAYTKLLLTNQMQKLIEESGFVPIN